MLKLDYIKITKANSRLIQMLNKLSGNVKNAPRHFGAIKYYVSIKLRFIPIKVSLLCKVLKHSFPLFYLQVASGQSNN